jgi:hypothetical protein
MDKQTLAGIIAELIQLGEDADELNYWLEIYEDLPAEQQVLLSENLQQELAALKVI